MYGAGNRNEPGGAAPDVEMAKKKDDYTQFCEHFSKCRKLGVREDSTNRTEVMELMRYLTAKCWDEMLSLEVDIEGFNDVIIIFCIVSFFLLSSSSCLAPGKSVTTSNCTCEVSPSWTTAVRCSRSG